ncbi:hypothetical protein D9V32_09515 [Mycetocola tolaasinivorans]|uniref:Uncharacterized protein n=1 Tax=Mycetocola tolaasinivorans TaxID=76635 RepID=A0A3L7A5U3_9MICO|nr:hypothetical protein [Mycetocola tolaasinivorans]RLP75696.1 hypothetical protein D9V32_09515 [Mycetocola tolaasinivorans]
MSNPVSPFAGNRRLSLDTGDLKARRSRWIVRIVAAFALIVVVGAVAWLAWPKGGEEETIASPEVTRQAPALVGELTSSLQATLNTIWVDQTPELADQLNSAALNATTDGRYHLIAITEKLKEDAAAVRKGAGWDGNVDAVTVTQGDDIRVDAYGTERTTVTVDLTINRHMTSTNTDWTEVIPFEMTFDNASGQLTNIDMQDLDSQH